MIAEENPPRPGFSWLAMIMIYIPSRITRSGGLFPLFPKDPCGPMTSPTFSESSDGRGNEGEIRKAKPTRISTSSLDPFGLGQLRYRKRPRSVDHELSNWGHGSRRLNVRRRHAKRRRRQNRNQQAPGHLAGRRGRARRRQSSRRRNQEDHLGDQGR